MLMESSRDEVGSVDPKVKRLFGALIGLHGEHLEVAGDVRFIGVPVRYSPASSVVKFGL
jgi:hypothetical protein